jgi:hypothetical protein
MKKEYEIWEEEHYSDGRHKNYAIQIGNPKELESCKTYYAQIEGKQVTNIYIDDNEQGWSFGTSILEDGKITNKDFEVIVNEISNILNENGIFDIENYDISFEHAKQMDCYKFTECYTKEQILNYENYPETLSQNVLAVLEFGNIDIELTLHDDGVAEYQVLAKQNEEYWDYTEEFIFNKNEYSEEKMFDLLMNCAKERSLCWSKLNI